ncbi:MAG TPA: Ig-like domain-containing protein, partial [Bacteroidales bacterium]
PSDASNKDIVWRSEDGTVATVANGLVTGIAMGNVKVIAVSKSDTTKKDTCNVTVTPASGQVITISGDITSDQTWYAVARYKLSGFVYVKNNATLTIEPGTIIQGISGTKAALMIERGSKIMAQGTAQKPIVFTSDKPKGQRTYGDWGGLVLLGKAKTNKHDSGTGVGIAEGGIGSLYGGDDDNDNSGILQYVRIEFPGIALTSVANSEINGLTLYAVGKATTIDHIQVSYSGDDSYEWFGGAVNCKNLVAWRGWDDDFDTDNGFTGTVQFIVSARDANASDQSGSNGFESDNDADGSLLTPTTHPIFCNASVFGPLATSATLPANHLFKRAMHIRRSSQCSVYNSVFVGWPKGLLLDGALGNTPTKADDNTLQIEKCILAGMQSNYEAASGTVAVPYTTAQIQAYFEASARGNNATATLTDILGSNLLSLTAPSFLPASGSILLSGASFTNTNLSNNSFLSQVTYLGAFGTTDWTSGWCNFDPQNTDY